MDKTFFWFGFQYLMMLMIHVVTVGTIFVTDATCFQRTRKPGSMQR